MSFTTDIKRIIPTWITAQVIKDLNLPLTEEKTIKTSKWKRIGKVLDTNEVKRLFSSSVEGIFLSVITDKNDNIKSHRFYFSECDDYMEMQALKYGITNNPSDYMFDVMPDEYDCNRVIVAVSPIKYYQKEGAQWDQHIEHMNVMPDGYYEEMESTFSTPYNKVDTINDLISHGLRYIPGAFQH